MISSQRITFDGVSLKRKVINNIQRPRRRRKIIIDKQRLVQNPLSGSYLMRELHCMAGTEYVYWSMEWCPCKSDIRKYSKSLPRVRVTYTEEELEYFRIMKELEEERRRTEKEAS